MRDTARVCLQLQKIFLVVLYSSENDKSRVGLLYNEHIMYLINYKYLFRNLYMKQKIILFGSITESSFLLLHVVSFSLRSK